MKKNFSVSKASRKAAHASSMNHHKWRASKAYKAYREKRITWQQKRYDGRRTDPDYEPRIYRMGTE